MSTLVMKFGGTSVGNAKAISQTASIVRDYGSIWDNIVVVVSAMRGVTDALVTGARTAADGDQTAYPSIVSDLRIKHTPVIAELLEEGVPGLHIYTMDRSKSTVGIVNELRRMGLL